MGKVAICGKAPDTLFEAPFADESWEIWILNTLGYLNEVPRWDRQFELHPINWIIEEPGYGEYYGWLKAQDGRRPIYMQAPVEEIRGCVVYPYDRVFEKFPRRYFTNSVSWMMALALLEGHEEIGLYGVNMAQHGMGEKSEYAHQRPSCEYFCGYADAAGVKLHVPAGSDLLKAPALYGFHNRDLRVKFDKRRQELQARVNAANAQARQSHEEAVFLAGALEALNYHEQHLLVDEHPNGRK